MRLERFQKEWNKKQNKKGRTIEEKKYTLNYGLTNISFNYSRIQKLHMDSEYEFQNLEWKSVLIPSETLPKQMKNVHFGVLYLFRCQIGDVEEEKNDLLMLVQVQRQNIGCLWAFEAS